jgi:hypothetical protein
MREWGAAAWVAIVVAVALTVGTLGVVLVAIDRGEPLSSQAVGIVSVVWGALAGGLAAWLGAQGRHRADNKPEDKDSDA